jgi:hypothetical protein
LDDRPFQLNDKPVPELVWSVMRSLKEEVNALPIAGLCFAEEVIEVVFQNVVFIDNTSKNCTK